jgi:hypothetical protein
VIGNHDREGKIHRVDSLARHRCARLSNAATPAFPDSKRSRNATSDGVVVVAAAAVVVWGTIPSADSVPDESSPTKTDGSVCFPTCYPLKAELIMARGEIQGHVLVFETWGTKTESAFYVARAIHSTTDSGQKDKRNQKDDVNVLQCVSWARFTSSKNKNRAPRGAPAELRKGGLCFEGSLCRFVDPEPAGATRSVRTLQRKTTSPQRRAV